MTLEVGALAPEFVLPATGGGDISLVALRGKPVVLYFYPKDMTSGCTLEAEAFRDFHADFAAAGAEVIGVSKDTVKKHDQFVAKHDLPFALVSDAEGDLCQRYGVWVEKSMYGRTYLGIERSTFLIAADGTLARIWRKVKVKGHAEEVLAAVRAL